MSLFKRAADVVRANLNFLIEGAEDPEKMIKLYLDDAQEHLVECKRAYHSTISAEKELKHQFDDLMTEVGIWQKRAELALSKGQEDLAKDALIEKNKYQTRANALKAPLESATKQKLSAESLLTALQERIADVQANSTVLIARARQAKASKAAADSLAGISSKDPFTNMKDMESKISGMEADAEASVEVAGASVNVLDNKFKVLESGDVDAELTALKEKMKTA